MSSSLRDKLSNMTTGNSADVSTKEDTGGQTNPTEKYLLKVTAGTTYENDTRHTVVVNGDDCTLDDRTKVAVRILDHHGMPNLSVAESDYFKHPSRTKDTYSIAFSWVPEEDVSAADLVWGIELVNPIKGRIPTRFITTAFNICKRFVDSSLSCDPDADRPWVNGAILSGSAMTFRVGGKRKEAASPPAVLSEGGDDDDSVRQQHGIPADESKRQKFFLSEENRKGFSLEAGRCYQFDFHNGYIDWKNYALKLPGFSLNVLKWINERTHTVRFVMKNRKTGQQYLVVTFRLLFGDELKEGIAGDARQASQDKSQASKEDDFTKATDKSSTEVTAHERKQEQIDEPQKSSSSSHQRPDSVVAPTFSKTGKENVPVQRSAPPQQNIDTRRFQNDEQDMIDHYQSKEQQQPRDETSITTATAPTTDASNDSNQTITTQIENVVGHPTANGPNSDTPESRGYRHSIEESLCSTASIDGRGKPSNVLG